MSTDKEMQSFQKTLHECSVPARIPQLSKDDLETEANSNLRRDIQTGSRCQDDHCDLAQELPVDLAQIVRESLAPAKVLSILMRQSLSASKLFCHSKILLSPMLRNHPSSFPAEDRA